MPNDFVQLPADSVGKRLRTYRLPTGDHVEAVRDAPTAPKSAALSSSAVAAGMAVDLTAPSVSVGAVGRLAAVNVSASVPVKAEMQVVTGGVPATVDVVFTSEVVLAVQWRPPHPNYLTAAAGDQFRVKITNLDTIDAANVYATVYWDEEA